MTQIELSALLDLLPKYTPFKGLDKDLLTMLAKDISVKTAEAGLCLFEYGDFDTNEYYLISGIVSLIAPDGRESLISTDCINARFPISRLRPRMYTAKAKGPISYLVVDTSVLDELQNNTRKNNNALVKGMQLKAGEEGHSLIVEFEQDLNTGRFVLPSLPEVAFRIRELIDNPNSNIKDLAKLVNTDPAIAAKLVKVANSVIYRGVNHCDDTQSAISRLGLITTKQLVTSFAVLALFETKSHLFKDHMRLLWEQSIEVAAYSCVLARELPHFNEAEALLAGLIHNIGEMIALTYAERFDDLATDIHQFNMVIGKLRGKLGEIVLSRWNFTEDLITVARESSDWMRGNGSIANDGSDFDYCDLVQIAKLYALEGKDTTNSSLPAIKTIPAVEKLNKLQLSTEQTTAIIEQANDQITELKTIFNQ